jgi:hypothetical protein
MHPITNYIQLRRFDRLNQECHHLLLINQIDQFKDSRMEYFQQ